MKNVSALVPGICVATLFFACTSSEGEGGGDGDGDLPAGDGDGSGGGVVSGDGDGDGPNGDGSGGSVPGGDGGSPGTGGSAGDGDGDGDGDTTGDGDTAGDGDMVPPEQSSGCGTADPPSGTLSLMVGDLERSYIVSLPDDYNPENAYPVIFGFHGLGGSAEGASGDWYLGLEVPGGTPSIFVYPDGIDEGDGAGWPNTGGRDVAFFDALLAHLKSTYCVDAERVFSTGHSYGGMMSFTLGCQRASDLRAIAPVAGAHFGGGQGGCSGPVAVLGIHGENDDVVEYESGVSAMERLIAENSCDQAASTPLDPSEFCVSYACDSAYPTAWCTHQDGHNWPDFAAETIKAFFDQF
jgi:polyhydroxybutyrate depolymerase